MPRPSSTYTCSDCGHETARWAGRCPGCGEWNTLIEQARPTTRRASGARGGLGGAGRAGAGAVRPVALADVEAVEELRLRTGIGELDNVLGGGIVPGSLVLIGGAPGIGKSTLTTMALGNLAHAGRRTLYVSAEESAAQIRLRAQRLSTPGALDIPVIAETDLHTVLATLEQERPEVCVIDSVQTLHSEELSSAAGSVAQVREVADGIMRVAKQLRIAVLLVGHVTKEGALAGPRVLEHLVDCVLQFEGERERTYRTVRAIKNRFGSTNEAGVFEMRDDGLVEVLDASARFLAEATRSPGSVVLCAMEGSRPLLVEVQALVSPSELVPPRRVVAGLDRNRVALVLAVLGRHGGLGLGAADVFVNVVGGVRVDEPGADLAVALAVASAAKGFALTGPDGAPLACFGELGLTGEVRTVAHGDRRLAEAQRFGLAPVLDPARHGTLRAVLRAGDAETARGRRGGVSSPAEIPQDRLKLTFMPSRSGEELRDELESRQESRIMRALEMVAPGTALRQGIDNIVDARTGALIVIGDPDELGFLFSGGIKLDIDYSPALLYELAKMDGAIALSVERNQDRPRQRPADPGPDHPHPGDGHAPSHRRARLQADRCDRHRRLRAAGGRLALRRRGQVHPRGDPGHPGQGQPGPGHPGQVPQPPGSGLDSAHRARVRGRGDPARRPHGAPAGRAGHADGCGDRALHRRARHRGPADRDAARRDDGRRGRRQGRRFCMTIWSRTATHGFADVVDQLARLPHQDLLDFGRLAELLGYDRKLNTLDYPVSPRGFRILGRIPRLPRLVVQRIVTEFGGFEELLAASDGELETVDGVGEIRAKDIREGLRRQQEINLVDRYLQT